MDIITVSILKTAKNLGKSFQVADLITDFLWKNGKLGKLSSKISDLIIVVIKFYLFKIKKKCINCKHKP